LRGVAFSRVGARSVLVAGLVVLAGSAVVAAQAETGTFLDAAIASKEQQLSALKSDIAEGGCDYAVDAPTIEGCQQLDAQARALGAEIESLKARASVPAARDAEPQASPQRHSIFKAHTDPNMSYRTFCVRECDGFYYPLSASSTPGSFLADEAKCQSSCSSPAKLYYSAIASEDASEMVSLAGEHYGDLANAYRYRSEYVDGCSCKPKPWSAEARAMFDRRAILATRAPDELIVAAGAGEVAKLLTAPEPKVAVHVASGRPRSSPVSMERRRLIPIFRSFRFASAAAQGEPLPQRRFFLFRSRY